MTGTFEVVGSRFFKAPEMEDGRAENVTTASDVYSLGKLLRWLFSGQRFEREAPRPALRLPREGAAHRARACVRDPRPHDQSSPAGRFFKDGNGLADGVDIQTERLTMDAHVLDLAVRQQCHYCGVGEYAIRVDPRWWFSELHPGRAATRGMAELRRAAVPPVRFNSKRRGRVARPPVQAVRQHPDLPVLRRRWSPQELGLAPSALTLGDPVGPLAFPGLGRVHRFDKRLPSFSSIPKTTSFPLTLPFRPMPTFVPGGGLVNSASTERSSEPAPCTSDPRTTQPSNAIVGSLHRNSCSLASSSNAIGPSSRRASQTGGAERRHSRPCAGLGRTTPVRSVPTVAELRAATLTPRPRMRHAATAPRRSAWRRSRRMSLRTPWCTRAPTGGQSIQR